MGIIAFLLMIALVVSQAALIAAVMCFMAVLYFLALIYEIILEYVPEPFGFILIVALILYGIYRFLKRV